MRTSLTCNALPSYSLCSSSSSSSSSDERRASEFVGLGTSQPFAALKQQVNTRSDGCRVLGQ